MAPPRQHWLASGHRVKYLRFDALRARSASAGVHVRDPLRPKSARDQGGAAAEPGSGKAAAAGPAGRKTGGADAVTPREAPFVTDDAAISRAAAEIAALDSRIAGALAAARGRRAAAAAAIDALTARAAAAERERDTLTMRLGAANRELESLKAGTAALKDQAAASKAEAESWRDQIYKSERMLIDELDRVAERLIAAAAPDPAAAAAAPEVSVVMPVFNRPELLLTAVRSVLAQTFRGWELIVVDDGSTDDIAGALRPLLGDKRIRLFRQRNRGECVTRNNGVRLARGEIVAYLDSDNYWYPNFLDAAVKVFRADPALEIAYGAIAYDWPNGDVRFYLLPYSRDAILRDNLADMNVIVHRRRSYELRGGFDETLTRAYEWDLMLRYTEQQPAAHIPVMGARYRIVDKDRQSATRPLYDNVFRIRQRWLPRPDTPPRVLFAAPAFPQASEGELHAAVACMRRFGAAPAIWAAACGASPGGAALAPGDPVHRGSLAEAIAAFRPDVVHVHGLALLGEQRRTIEAAGVPVTLRGRATDTAPDAIARALTLPNLSRAYLMPGAAGPQDARLRRVAPVFDTALFAPSGGKDRRLVLRAAPAVPESNLRFVLDLAKLLPSHRFVVAVASVRGYDNEIEALRAYRDEIASPAEILVDAPRAEMAKLFAAAAICVHSGFPAGPGRRARAGGPASLVEAMATGAYVLARKEPPYIGFVGKAGALYADAAQAATLIQATETWSGAEWREAEIRAIDHAFRHHTGELALRPLFEDWCAIAQERRTAAQRT